MDLDAAVKQKKLDRALLVERLYGSASHHTRSAARKSVSDDRDTRLDAAIHIGTAVELIAKAVLVSVDPRLIIDEHATHHALVDLLIEQGLAAGTPQSAGKDRGRKTVVAAKAVDLAARLTPVMASRKQAAHAALKTRNAAAHAAELDDAVLEQTVAAGAAFALAGVYHLGREADDFLGPELKHEVEAFAEDREAAVLAMANSKIEMASRKYSTMVEHLDEFARRSVLQSFADRYTQSSDIEEPHTCPSCPNSGLVMTDVDIDVEWAGPDEYIETPFLSFRGFECPFCALQLNELECEAVGIDPRDDPAEIFGEYNPD